MPQSDRDLQPLSPYRVLDLTEGGFNWCGKVLADFGADVIKVEPPSGSPTRKLGPFVGGVPGHERSLFWAAYCVNKRGVTLDLESRSGRDQLKALASGADILIESFKPGIMESKGLGYADLEAINPGLVYTSITQYGQTGPYSQHDAPDLVAWSMGGMQYLGGDADRPPVRIGAPQAELHAGAHAAVGTMAAFWHGQKTGEGQHVDVSMQTAVIWTLMNATPFPPLHGVNMERDGAFRSRGPLAVRHVYECMDGHVSLVAAPRTLSGLAVWMAEEGAAPDWLLGIDWENWNLTSIDTSDPEGMPQFEAVQGEFESFVATKTKLDLFLRAIELGMLLAPCHTVEDIALSEQLEAREFWHDVEHPVLGRKLTHLGPFIKFGSSPIQVRRPAPRLGEHNEEVLSETSPAGKPVNSQGANASPQLPAMPFYGIKVLDFTWVGVGPITIKHLADFGADVIRVESVTRPDVLRGGAPFKDGEPGLNRSQFAANYNSSKRGLGVNLATPEGRELIKDLIREWKPDIIAESFTPRVMAGWGLAYEDIRKILPDVIYLSTCQQGQTGPHSSFAGFGQLAGAMAGFYHITGWPDREPAGPYGAYSDFVNPPNAAAALVAALEFRRRTGKGQHLDLSQYECATHFLAPAIMDYLTNGTVLNRRGNEDDDSVPHNVYLCANRVRNYTGEGKQWIAIVVSNDSQWQVLCAQMGRGELGSDPRFSTVEARLERREQIDELIGEWTREKSARRLMVQLQEAGVPAGVVQSQADLWEDPQVEHRGFFQWLEHAECGLMPYDGLTYHLSKTPGALRMPQALVGQHNAEILGDILGMDAGGLDGLLERGILEQS